MLEVARYIGNLKTLDKETLIPGLEAVAKVYSPQTVYYYDAPGISQDTSQDARWFMQGPSAHTEGLASFHPGILATDCCYIEVLVECDEIEVGWIVPGSPFPGALSSATDNKSFCLPSEMAIQNGDIVGMNFDVGQHQVGSCLGSHLSLKC